MNDDQIGGCARIEAGDAHEGRDLTNSDIQGGAGHEGRDGHQWDKIDDPAAADEPNKDDNAARDDS